MAHLAYSSDHIPVSSAQLVAWRGSKVGSTLRLSGPCPACHHDMPTVVSLTSTSLEGTDREPQPDKLTVSIHCSCGRAHPGWPGAPPKGCGRSWTGTVQVAVDGRVTIVPPHDPFLAEAAEALRLSQAGQLERLRSAGEKWIAGITALFGVLGVLGLTLSADQIRKLALGGRVTVAVVLAVAVVAAGVAIVRAYQAAYGWPRTRSISDDAELRAWYDDHQAQTGITAARLREAAAAAGLVLAFLTVAGGLTWFLPPAKPEAPILKVTTSDQAIVCGTLLSSRTDAVLQVRRADDGTVEMIPVSDILRFTTVGKC
ncbi:hypothetical protein [Micromonospora sp. NPDC047187]|uniref:hypothetical protein n=1 Tax=Micromonospora sp. NPDC047187 TaxID=3155262 RepID=UPI0033E72007